MIKNLFRVLGGFAAASSLSFANAAIDVSSVVTDIGLALAPIALVGAAVLSVKVGTKTFKWIRGAL